MDNEIKVKSKRKNRILATNVPDTIEGRFVYHAISFLAERENRSVSKTIMLILQDYINKSGDQDLINYADNESVHSFDSANIQ